MLLLALALIVAVAGHQAVRARTNRASAALVFPNLPGSQTWIAGVFLAAVIVLPGLVEAL